MVPRYWMAPAALFILQTAPVAVVPDSNGWYRVAVGAEAGSYLERLVSCSGDVLDEERIKFRTVGGEAEVWLDPSVRITSHAGQMSVTGTEGNPIAVPYEGFFGGAVVAFEGTRVGLGAGLSTVPPTETGSSGQLERRVLPLGYARFGRLDKGHLRLEVGGPAAPGAPPDRFRIGVGGGMGRLRRTGGQVYLGVADFPTQEDGLVAGGVLLVPVGRAFDLGIAGAVRGPLGGNIGVFGRVKVGRGRAK